MCLASSIYLTRLCRSELAAEMEQPSQYQYLYRSVLLSQRAAVDYL